MAKKKKLRWKKEVRKAPHWLKTWKKNNDRIEYHSTNSKFLKFKIKLTYKGWTLFIGGDHKRVQTFYELKSAKACAQMIVNG